MAAHRRIAQVLVALGCDKKPSLNALKRVARKVDRKPALDSVKMVL